MASFAINAWQEGFGDERFRRSIKDFVASAAQRGNDDHFIASLQAMVQAGDAVAVHEETDVRADSILFVRDRRLCLKFTAFNIRD